MTIVLRGYVSNHLPLSNGFETMQFMAWCTVLLTFFLQRKFTLSVPFGFLLCGLTLLVSMFGEQNPQITQLMPVLQSPLLSIHVVAIMTADSLPGRIPAHHRHLYRSCLGQCIMGALLGLGPERSVGTYHHAGLRAGTAPGLSKMVPLSDVLSCIWHCGVPHCINHLFWSEFSARRHAQLCQWIKRMKRSIATMP